MTIYFPDVSNWQQGMSLAGSAAVIAKATEGTGYTDPFYAGYHGQAANMGVPFVGYHYLHHGSIEAQAALAFSVVGAGVPLMLDVEVVQGEADPTLDDVTQFVAAYRARGGRVTLIYLPQWFWSGHWGSPDLRPLAKLGLALISSNYTTYSDTGPGWAAYGGVAPAIWQYTSSATVNGRAKVDMNAFRGSPAELAALFNGSTVEENMGGFDKLDYGAEGWAVRDMQHQLRDAGAAIDVTGKFDDATAAALVKLDLTGSDSKGHTFGDTEQARLRDLVIQAVIKRTNSPLRSASRSRHSSSSSTQPPQSSSHSRPT